MLSIGLGTQYIAQNLYFLVVRRLSSQIGEDEKDQQSQVTQDYGETGILLQCQCPMLGEIWYSFQKMTNMQSLAKRGIYKDVC